MSKANTNTSPASSQSEGKPAVSPVGSTARAGSRRRAQRSAAYREELGRLAPYEGSRGS